MDPRAFAWMKRLAAMVILVGTLIACGETDPVRTHQYSSWALIDLSLLDPSGAPSGPVYFTVAAYPDECGGVRKASTGKLRAVQGHRRIALHTSVAPFIATCFELTFRPDDDPDRVILTVREDVEVLFRFHHPQVLPDSVAFVVTLPGDPGA